MEKIKTSILLMTVFAFCALVALGSVPSISGGLQQCNADESRPPPNTTIAEEHGEKTVGTPEEFGSLRAYIDPETGELSVPPTPEAPALERLVPPHAFSTSHEGLEVRPSPEPGGGMMIDLKGRFRNPLSATKDSNGTIKIEHQAGE